MVKKGRVLLMTPNLKGVKDGLNRIQPPLGPMIAASILRGKGHEVYIHDCALEGWENQKSLDEKTIIIGQTDSQIASTIDSYKPDIVGISALFSNLMESAHNLARITKSVRPNTKVILGGNHISNAISDYLYAKHTSNSGLPSRLRDMEDTNIDYTMK